MQVRTDSPFLSFDLPPGEESQARLVPPQFLVYLQNKIAAYAEALVEQELPYSENPAEQVKAILALERKRNFVQAYQELLSELTPL